MADQYHTIFIVTTIPIHAPLDLTRRNQQTALLVDLRNWLTARHLRVRTMSLRSYDPRSWWARIIRWCWAHD